MADEQNKEVAKIAKDGLDFDRVSKLLGIVKSCADIGGLPYIAQEASTELDLMNHNLMNAHRRKQGLEEMPHPKAEQAKSNAPAAAETEVDHDPKTPLPVAQDKPIEQRRV